LYFKFSERRGEAATEQMLTKEGNRNKISADDIPSARFASISIEARYRLVCLMVQVDFKGE
jgi:hypothetical protein